MCGAWWVCGRPVSSADGTVSARALLFRREHSGFKFLVSPSSEATSGVVQGGCGVVGCVVVRGGACSLLGPVELV